MRVKEFPDTLDEALQLADDLEELAENEPDKEKRRELHLLRIELRDHIIRLGRMKTVTYSINDKCSK